jgi:enoyl-CoA hydratase/carnithine racemase
MTTDTLHVVSEHPAEYVLLIRLVRPEKRNALSNPMVYKIAGLLADAESDDSIRCVVITGVDEAFCAGADIAEMRETDGKAVNDPRRVAAWHVIENFKKPIIAAINGYAFGAGNELALTTDFIIAGRNAKFGQPEVKIGGIAGDGGTQRLPRKIGVGFASYMLFTGDPIDAETALRVGHVVEVVDVDKTVSRAVEIAAIIASRAPLAVMASKACVRDTLNSSLHSGVVFERNEVWKISGTPDTVEGGRSFLEKRPPRFTGKWF